MWIIGFCFVLFVFRRTMADTKAVTIRTRKFMTNRLLSRKQFVSSILHTAFVFLNLDLYIGFHVDLFGFRETVLKENESSYLRFWSYYFFILFYFIGFTFCQVWENLITDTIAFLCDFTQVIDVLHPGRPNVSKVWWVLFFLTLDLYICFVVLFWVNCTLLVRKPMIDFSPWSLSWSRSILEWWCDSF